MKRIAVIAVVLFLAVAAGVVVVWQFGDREAVIAGDVTNKPERSFWTVELEPVNSRLVASASLDLSKLQARANEKLPTVLAPLSGKLKACYEMGILRIGCKWQGEVRKNGPVRVFGKDGKLHLHIPVYIEVEIVVPKLRLKETVTAALTVMVESLPEVSPEWTLDLNLKVGYEWDKKPSVTLGGGIKASFGKATDAVLKERLADIDQLIAAEMDFLMLRQKMATAWKTLYQPIQASKQPPVWMLLDPHRIDFSGISIEENTMNLSLGVSIKLQTHLGPQPQPHPARPLPPLGKRVSDREKFVVRLPLLLNYETLERQIGKALKMGETWAPSPEQPELLLTVTAVEVYPSAGTLVFGAQFALDAPVIGEVSAAVYLQGTPEIDNENKIFRLKNFDFTETSDSVVVDTVLGVFKGQIQNIVGAAEHDFSADYDEMLAQVNRSLSRDLGNGLALRGKLDDVSIDGIKLLENEVLLLLSTRGSVAVHTGL